MSSAAPPLPPHMDQVLRRELTRGERLIWAAQPRAARMKSVLWMWVFALPWTLFALFWESGALSILGRPYLVGLNMEIAFGIFFPIFGLPFVAIGFWMMWKPIAAMRQARDTAYGLTNLRIFRVVEGHRRIVASVALDRWGRSTDPSMPMAGATCASRRTAIMTRTGSARLKGSRLSAFPMSLGWSDLSSKTARCRAKRLPFRRAPAKCKA